MTLILLYWLLQPFPAPSLLSVCSSQAVALARERRVKRIGVLMICNIMCVCLLVAWCTSTHSMGKCYIIIISFM
jgi:hypothetical protein